MENLKLEMALPSILKQLEMYNPFSLSLPLLLPILLFILIQLLKLTRARGNLPPSPPKLPIIGNLHQVLQNLPHRSFKALSERYGPLMYVYFGNTPSLVVSSAELASQVMKTHDIAFSNRPKSLAAHILLYECKDLGNVNYGEYWRQLRKICVLELLSPKRVQSAQHVRVEEVSCLINKIRCSCLNGGGINLSEMLLAVSNNIASRCVFGRKVEGGGGGGGNGGSKFGELTRRQMMLMTSFCFGDLYPSLKWIDVLTGFIGRLHKTATDLGDLLDQVIEEHRVSLTDDDQSDKKDFVHVLLQLQKNGNLAIELTQDTIKAILMVSS